MSEWQKIDSAPKDGKRILACGGTFACGDHEGMEAGHVFIVQWRKGCGWLNDSQYEGEDIWHEPTHWQPLPPPPEGDKQL